MVRKTPANSNRRAQYAELTAVNADDFLASLGMQYPSIIRPWLRLLCLPLAQRFARQVIIFDELVGLAGLQAGHAWMLKQFAHDIDVRGVEHLPATGPLLIVANHPGLTDSNALMAHIQRRDLRIIAYDNAFLRALPHTSQYLFSTNKTRAGRLRVIRRSAHHLRDGGALLLYPGGEIEPDPGVLPGALDALGSWSGSMDLFARLAPEIAIVPAVVSNVLSAQALGVGLIRMRRKAKDQETLAAMLQVVFPRLQDTVVRLAFGAPIRPTELSDQSEQRVSRAVLGEMRRLLEAR